MWWLIIEMNTTNNYMIPGIKGRRYLTDGHYLYISI